MFIFDFKLCHLLVILLRYVVNNTGRTYVAISANCLGELFTVRSC